MGRTEIVRRCELFQANNRRAARRELGQDRASYSTQTYYGYVVVHG
jgi:hypothetical protein